MPHPEAPAMAAIVAARADADALRQELADVVASMDADAPMRTLVRSLRRVEALYAKIELTGQ